MWTWPIKAIRFRILVIFQRENFGIQRLGLSWVFSTSLEDLIWKLNDVNESIFYFCVYVLLMKFDFYVQGFEANSIYGIHWLDSIKSCSFSAKGTMLRNMNLYIEDWVHICVWTLKNNLRCNCKLDAGWVGCCYVRVYSLHLLLRFLFFDLCFKCLLDYGNYFYMVAFIYTTIKINKDLIESSHQKENN